MIHPLVKIIAVDDFFSKDEAQRLCNITYDLQYVQKEFGKEIENFNMVPQDCDIMFNNILGTKVEVVEDLSGVFRKPDNFIHFEPFDSTNEWVFVVALQQTTFNVFEHKSGTQNALQDYKYNYRNLFEWNNVVNYELEPGHGILFRPWLFHSFSTGHIQLFRLKEKNDNAI